MSQLIEITINDQKHALAVKEYRRKRVVSLKEIDTLHERADGTARRNFNSNLDRFIKGEDFYEINQPNEIRTLGFERPQGGTPDKVVLLTESGYLMLVKSFTDNLAWEVQRQLVKTYFRVKSFKPLPPNTILKNHLSTAMLLSKGLSKQQQINLRIIAVKQAQEESGVDYSDILAVLSEPQGVMQSSSLVDFLRNRCVLGSGHKVGRTELYDNYVKWCDMEQVSRLHYRAFLRELQLSCPAVSEYKTNVKRYWKGIDVLGS